MKNPFWRTDEEMQKKEEAGYYDYNRGFLIGILMGMSIMGLIFQLLAI